MAIKLEGEKTQNALEVMQTSQDMLENKMTTTIQNLNAEMSRIDAIKTTVDISND